MTTSIKKLTKIVLTSLLIVVVILWKNKSTLTIENINFGSGEEFYLDSSQITNLLKYENITKNELSYSIYKIEKPSKEITFYSIKVEPIRPNDADYRYQEGILVKTSLSDTVLQGFLEHVSIDGGIESGLDSTSKNVSFLDINKDGYKEFVIQGDKGGNSIRSNIRKIYQLNNGEFKELKLNGLDNEPYTLSEIIDIDNDGFYEAVVIDSEWEISSCTDHSSGPIRYLIYSWDGNMYKDNSSKFPQFYEQYLSIDISKECSGKKEFCFGPALGKYFAFKQAGKEKEGWDIFLKNTNGVSNLTWPSKSCRNYLIDLHDTNNELKEPSLTTHELLNSEYY